MPYSLDTSSIIDARVRHYPPDVVPSLWVNMDKSARNGEILVIEEVLRELGKKDDDVYTWVKERSEMHVPIDEEIQDYLASIMSKYGRLVDTRKNRSGADPWVIALAQARGLTVVTTERASGNLAKPKIPDVCRELGVPCIGNIEMFREQGWRW